LHKLFHRKCCDSARGRSSCARTRLPCECRAPAAQQSVSSAAFCQNYHSLYLVTQHIERACGVAKVGAAVRHVQVHGAGAVVEGQDAVQRLGEVRQRRVGHRLAPARQPPRAARGARVRMVPRSSARKHTPAQTNVSATLCSMRRPRCVGTEEQRSKAHALAGRQCRHTVHSMSDAHAAGCGNCRARAVGRPPQCVAHMPRWDGAGGALELAAHGRRLPGRIHRALHPKRLVQVEPAGAEVDHPAAPRRPRLSAGMRERRRRPKGRHKVASDRLLSRAARRGACAHTAAAASERTPGRRPARRGGGAGAHE